MSEQNGIYSYNPSTNEILFRLNPICKCNKEVVQVLNEQQATINELTKNRDRWRELAKLHNGYFNCLEKAIEKAYEEKPYPKIEDIMDIYSELEKEFDDE